MVNPTDDVATLLQAVVDTVSVSGGEAALADDIEAALGGSAHLDVSRWGNVVVARTNLGRPSRVVIAGHLDTVPVADNLPSRWGEADGRRILSGRGTVDMKGGLAVQLNLAAALTQPSRDITWVFYDNEEVEAAKNGLGHLVRRRPDLVQADMAILMEPSGGAVEAGCQGTLRADIVAHGLAAHSARAWLGHNAIHDLAGALTLLNDYEPAAVLVDGLTYREGLNAVGIAGGIAGNVIPDRARLTLNYRFAPDKDLEQAADIVRAFFAGYEVEVTDGAPGARPGLTTTAVASFVAAVGRPVKPKFGWTDVARFATLGIPAVNFGPGDPNLAHTDEEYVYLDDVVACRDALHRWLT